MKMPKIKLMDFFIAMQPRRATIAIVAYFIFHTSYLLSGCVYTLDGNPDVNLITVGVSPLSATVVTNGSLQLTASNKGWLHTGGVSWSVAGTGNGTILANGLTATYQAPATPVFSVVIRVTSNEDGTRYAECPISVVSPPDTGFDPSPIAVSLLTNSSQQFTIDTLTAQSTIPRLKWSIASGPGTITDSGLYTPPDSVSTDNTLVLIKASSVSNPAYYSEAAIYLVKSSDSVKYFFTKDIEPILSGSCGGSGCHDAATHAGNYNFLTYSGTIGSVKRGNARASRLYSAIIQLNANSRMPPPPQPAVGPNQVFAIGQWIDEGALDNP
jgi:hypothetical protein